MERKGIMRCKGRSAVGSQTRRFSFSILHSFLSAGFGRLALFRGMPLCFRQHLHCISFVRGRAGIGICSPACSVVTDRGLCCYLSFLNIHTFVSFCLRVHCVSCVDGPCPCVPLLIRTRVSVSVSLSLSPFIACS